MLPFDHLRVLDFSRQAPGPFATMMLADFGAQIIAVEPPPGVADQPAKPYTAIAKKRRRFDPIYRGKRSLILDLKQEAAREVARRLAKSSDIVVEGFRPGVVARLGIDYEALRKENPALIYCSVTGYGQDGPDRLTAGHDIDYIARSGSLSLFARPGQAPVPPLNALGDYAGGGLMAAFAIATAIVARDRTGDGQYIDMSMTDGVLSLLAPIYADSFERGLGMRPRMGEYVGGELPFYTVYASKDGRWFAVGAEEAHFWRALVTGLGRDDLLPLQHDQGKRAWVYSEIEREFAARDSKEILRLYRGVDSCVELALTPGEALRSKLTKARGMVAEAPVRGGGTVKTVGVAPRLSATPGRVPFAAALPGEDTLDVLKEAGYGPEEIDRLLTDRLAFAAPGGAR